mgnify:CR=1 FL=1
MTTTKARRSRFCLLSLILLAAAVFLFVGVEEHPGEHESRYKLFMKQRPTLKTVHVNPVKCGLCHAIFHERQRQIFEKDHSVDL